MGGQDSKPFLLMWPRRAAAFIVVLYQRFLSPLKRFLFGANAGCRFYPTCSEYARVAFLRHGFFRGAYLATGRLCRCHPFHPGGEDLVPEATPASSPSDHSKSCLCHADKHSQL